MAAERAALEDRIVDLDPAERSEAYEELAMRFHAQSFLGEAIELYGRSLDTHLDPVRARYLRALARLERGRIVPRSTTFARCSIRPSSMMDAVRWWAIAWGWRSTRSAGRRSSSPIDRCAAACERTGGDSGSARRYRRCGGEWDQARGLLKRALVEQPGAGQIAYKLALAHRELGDQDEARRWLERRNDVAPAVTDPWLLAVAEFSESPRVFLDLAEQSWQRGDRADAIAAYERAVALAPGNAGIHLSLAVALAATNQNERAAETPTSHSISTSRIRVPGICVLASTTGPVM